MVIQGHVHNGVVVLDNGMVLPEGAEVTISCTSALPNNSQERVQLPLIASSQPGTRQLTAESAAELLDDDELSR